MALFGDIPQPKMIADVGPGGSFFTNYNAISKANLENTKAALVNSYYPQKTQAEIQHLTAPAVNYGPQAGYLAYLQARKAGQSPGVQGSPQNSQPQPNPMGNGLLGMALNYFNQHDQSSPNALMQPPQAPQNNAAPNNLPQSDVQNSPMGAPPSPGKSADAYGPMGQSDRATPDEATNIADNGNGTQSTSNFPASGQDAIGGFEAKAMAPGSEQTYPAGTGYFDRKTNTYKVTSSPTQLSQDQVGMSAIQTAIPLIRRLQDEGDELLKNGKTYHILTSGGAAILQNLGASKENLAQFGISPDFYNKYLQFQRDQANVAERLQTAYNFGHTDQGNAQAASILAPGFFENNIAYRKSMDKEIGNLFRQNEVYKGHSTGGFNVSPGAMPETPKMGKESRSSSAAPPAVITWKRINGKLKRVG